MPVDRMVLVSIYILFGLINLGWFTIQRACLNISRLNDVPYAQAKAILLPKWYPLAWLTIIGNWVVLGVLLFSGDWRTALALFLSDHIVSAVVPLPYNLALPLFLRECRKLEQADPENGATARRRLLGTYGESAVDQSQK